MTPLEKLLLRDGVPTYPVMDGVFRIDTIHPAHVAKLEAALKVAVVALQNIDERNCYIKTAEAMSDIEKIAGSE